MSDDPIRASDLEPIVARYGADPFNLLQMLIRTQDLHGWLPPEAIAFLCRRLRLPLTKVLGVASFYAFLHLEPRGRYRVLFSDNITDRMAGSQALLSRLCAALGVAPGDVSPDGLASVGRTSCTGMGDQGPALLVNGRAVPRIDAARIDRIVGLMRRHEPLEQWPTELFEVHANLRRKDVVLRTRVARGAALSAGLARGAQGLIDEIARSGLRGRGGAGFATAAKWAACRNAPGQTRYVVCNADEGEPGTFKDRVLLSERADLVFEGMTLCAFAIGASRGMVYLRGEYRHLLPHLEAVLARRRQAGLLGSSIRGRAGFAFDIEIHLGAGAYVCGEESALLDSLEGKRGTPRNRPPFPVTHGYRNQPTVVNNVETFAATSLIALRGGAWWAGIGTPASAGTKLLSVSGDCERPGIYEYPFGVSVRRVLTDCGAHGTQAVQVGGPSGTCIGAAEFDRRLCFEDLATAGAFMVFDRRRDMFEVARNFVQFFAHESCGFCTPCRVGTTLLRKQMDKLHEGLGSPYDFAEIRRLNEVLKSMSHCGLGHTACNPVVDTIAKFGEAYERRLVHHDFVPAFDLDAALEPARTMTGRQDEGAYLGSGIPGDIR
jgi:[NiFe] hydrogenase diaphorase moiety large subunit